MAHSLRLALSSRSSALPRFTFLAENLYRYTKTVVRSIFYPCAVCVCIDSPSLPAYTSLSLPSHRYPSLQRQQTVSTMRASIVALAFAALVAATPKPGGITSAIAPAQSPPPGCSPNYDGTFVISPTNLTASKKRGLDEVSLRLNGCL